MTNSQIAHAWFVAMRRIHKSLCIAFDYSLTYMERHRTAALIAAAGARFDMEMNDA